MNIAWIGVGIMGKHMAKHLSDAGFNVKVYNRTFSKALELEKYGLKAVKSIKEAIEGVDYIFTMVGMPEDVENVYLGENGIYNNLLNKPICIDMTTSSPKLAKKIASKFEEKKIYVLDAPVSGGDIGAKNKKLSIMVGGNFNAFKNVEKLFQIIGENINYVGSSGNGQHAKMANQIVIAGTIASVCESLYYCYQNKLSPNIVMKCIETGAAQSWQLINNGRNIIKNEFSPGFFIKHFVKDMKIAISESKDDSLIITSKVLSMYEVLVKNGMEEYGTQALIFYYLNS